MYESYLYFWTGKKWKVMLHMPGYAGQTLYGTGPKEVFLSVSGCDWVGQLDCQQTHPRMFRYDGLTWTEQSLPVAQTVGDVQGVPGFVLGSAFGYLLKYQNGAWSLDFQPNWVDTHAVWVFGPEEAYYVGCGGHGYWDGAWHEVYTGQWCDTSDMWGMYDENGLLHMVAVGNVTFSNAFRIWRYHPQTRSYTLELSEPVTPSFEAGSASRVWGFAPDDIYVVGRIGPWSNPIGRIYHYDGTAWNMVNDAGPLPVVNSVHGSGPTDVWFGLNDGRLLHFGDPLP